MLLFKKKFLDAIRDGRKTQTVRLWRGCRMRAGQLSYVPGVGYIRIGQIDEVQLDALTDDDAVLDGFESAAALLAEIRTLYADRLYEGYRAYRIRFRRLTETEESAERARKQAAKRSAATKPTRTAASRRSPE